MPRSQEAGLHRKALTTVPLDNIFSTGWNKHSEGVPMKKRYGVMLTVLIILLSTALIGIGIVMAQKTEVPSAPNGIKLPDGYKNWRLISSTHRADNNTLRVILGNDAAVQAARNGQTNPWPDGSIIAKLVWKDATHEQWPTAIIPGVFVHAEFMIKDAKKYSATGGWGFARWLGMEQKPYGKDADFVQECYGCHIPVKQNDYVYTHPAVTP
jgi:hypothetical protein